MRHAGAAPVETGGQADFGALDARSHLRLVIPSATATIVGVETIFGSFLLSMWRLGGRADLVGP